MKKNFLLIAVCFTAILQQIAAQKKFIASTVSPQSVISLRSNFSNYFLFSINTAEIAEFTKKQKAGNADFELQLPGLANWKFTIAEDDILSKDYTLIVNTPDGKITMPRPDCMTYAGYLSDITDSRVRLTIDKEIIYGIIKSGENEYFIEPLRYFEKQTPGNLFVVYNKKDVQADAGLTCGVTEAAGRGNSLQRLFAGTNCVQTQLAIASDESMFIRYGSAAAVETHNIGVMNNVIWDYVNAQFTDNIEFVIVTQNVSTSAATDQLTPAYTGTDAGDVLDNFKDWGEAGGFGTVYDLGQFWTTRNLDDDGAGTNAGIVGLAYLPAVCGTSKYHILEDFTGSNPSGSGYRLRVLTSHEIGHNFNCVHDGSGSGFIMAPSVNNTGTWSATSVTAVDAYVPGLACLSACSLAGVPIVDFITTPEAACTGATLQLTDHSLNGPTSWSWTMTGGSPASSTIRNPTVTYATSGIKSITLTSTNAGGSGTGVSKNILASSTPATACVNSGASTTEAGVKSFTLNTISKATGSANVDGNKYMDFSCSNITRLNASTLYTVSVNVGLFSATDPTPPHIFNRVRFYIDYNNNGDFTDPGETVYTSGSGSYVGTHAFDFTTPASVTIDQLLRARIIAADAGSAASPCHDPSAGQVEDYSVYFSSLILLPVSLLSFDGYHHNGKNILNWKTSAEKDNSHFDIERSVNGISFDPVGRVNGALNNNSINRYTFTDQLTGAFAGHNRLFYRLKMVDLDGSAKFSKVIAITSRANNNDLVISMQPNPFRDAINSTIHLKSPVNTLHMQLTDITGRTIYRDVRSLPAGIHTIAYDNLGALARGVYVIRLTSNSETVSRLIEKQ